MSVTAEDLGRWAKSPEARAALPELVRRLILHAGGTLTRLTMPSGSGTDQPGWDGIVEAAAGNAWVPAGRSCWELSCERDVARKAKADLEKRTRETSPEERADATFVFATPRPWSGKDRWRAGAQGRGWREVRACDAHDLVAWLGAAPAVALWLAETLGRAGPGLESPERFFARWSEASDPRVTARALAVGRFRESRALHRLIAAKEGLITLRADSEEEAAAFAAAVLQRNPRLAAPAAVVTAPSGWQWVAQIPDLSVVLCATSTLAEGREPRDDLVVLVPWARGDVSPFEREPGRTTSPEIRMPRPEPEAFIAALRRLGVNEERARALARRCGRSWSAFRRLHATSPAFRGPPWLDRPEARGLSIPALLGLWEQRRDRAIVEAIAGRPYEEIECGLRILADQPDPPVLELDGIWKAKAPAELFLVMGPRITEGEIDRFLEQAEAVLASRYGTNGSDRLRSAFADALARLAVLGPGSVKTRPDIEARVRHLVAELLDGADAQRWLSVADLLPSLAEAAPDAFLDAAEKSLHAEDQPIAALFHETDDGPTGRCWFAPLLWALERLAWDPAHLLRVCEVLCALSAVPRNDRFGNGPGRSLLSLFRPWYPQTNASLEERLSVLDRLSTGEPDLIFYLCLQMLPNPSDPAWPNARPAWRDEWLRPVSVTLNEWKKALKWAANRAIELAEERSGRLAELVRHLVGFQKAGRAQKALELLFKFARSNPSDVDREILRRALRTHLYIRKRSREAAKDPLLGPLEALYAELDPVDLIVRHAWLFANSPIFPDRKEDYDGFVSQLNELWKHALREIVGSQGLDGVAKLAARCERPDIVGTHLGNCGMPESELVGWLLDRLKSLDREGPEQDKLLQGFFVCVYVENRLPDLLERVASAAQKRGFTSAQTAFLLAHAPSVSELWDTVENLGDEVARAYWTTANPIWVRGLSGEKTERAARAFLAVGRPHAAFDITQSWLLQATNDSIDPLLLFKILKERPRSPGDERAPVMDYTITKAFQGLEEEPAIHRDDLAKLQLAFLDIIVTEQDREQLQSLWRKLTSDPEWFVELLKMLSHAQNEPWPELNAEARSRAKLARNAFDSCTRLPGQREDGSVDGKALNAFVGRARELAREVGRLVVCDKMLGHILSHAPVEPDGLWPCEPVAALLDRREHEELRNGFVIGTWNGRGVTSRSPDQGGEPERQLAERYRRFAERWSTRYPRTKALLNRLADDLVNSAIFSETLWRRQMEGLW